MKHKARKRFGQNFLHDQGIIQQIIHAIQPGKSDNIVEIGPGKGALTAPLLHAATKLNVIELDRDLIPILKQNLGYSECLNIHNVDALKYDFSQLEKEKNHLRVVGNLPYNISTPLLFHLINYASVIKDMHFMLQKEVVDRITAKPNHKNYGRLSVMLQYHCFAEKLFVVKPGAFSPAPKIDSAIIRLIPYSDKPVKANNLNVFSAVVSQSFSQRRKTLRNNLKSMLNEDEIAELAINPAARAETLSIGEFVKLANQVNNKTA
ncbi:MAG TPA: 16S rRNA (adenine(1518)-N(6)/adenine(1519)-N(6))-dimethyltransferase RsmA [Gammaproteobacteria bacterium]|nr:16S rRNA (adenine(1518)-N(6)/adenine(1519)-N(6))-dimethyltransferase RsmA [Gammaproteobacteria bacterium]